MLSTVVIVLLHVIYLHCGETAETSLGVFLFTELALRCFQFNELKSCALFTIVALLQMVIRYCNTINITLEMNSR